MAREAGRPKPATSINSISTNGSSHSLPVSLRNPSINNCAGISRPAPSTRGGQKGVIFVGSAPIPELINIYWLLVIRILRYDLL